MNFYQEILAVWDIASTLTKTVNRRIGSRGPATEGNRRTVHRGDRINTWFSAEAQPHFLSEGYCRRAL
jgi:hypothetical protein